MNALSRTSRFCIQSDMRIPLLALIVCLGVASVAPAQDTQSSTDARGATAAPSPQPVNPDDLGVSIDRIRLKFRRESLFDDVFDPQRLKMTTYVDVVAKGPEIRLFGPNAKEELTSHAVPFGAPTHRDMLAIMTPQEFRAYPMDLTALTRWLAEQIERKKEAK
jgi:hypothetical protein